MTVEFTPSYKEPHAGSIRIGDADPNERLTVTFLAKTDNIGANVHAIVEFIQNHPQIAIVYGHFAAGRVQVSGTVADFESVFPGLHLDSNRVTGGEYDGFVFRQRVGSLNVPEELASHLTGIYGLDNRPAFKRHSVLRGALEEGEVEAHAGQHAYSPAQIAQLYQFPAGFDGTGTCIAWIELGGGYSASDNSQAGIAASRVTFVGVDGASNGYTGNPNSADGEVALDIQVSLLQATGAKGAVYMGPNTSQGFVDAILDAIHDTTNSPNVISISWGSAETQMTQQVANALEQAAEQSAVPLFVASGDNGSSDGLAGNNVDSPSSSPSYTGCGGTFSAPGNEVVWNSGGGATGGGYSQFYSVPSWQSKAQTNPKRGVPDVAANADPQSGYPIVIGGHQYVFGGTSAAAPCWAALTAILTQALKKNLGLFNPILYSMPASCFQDITSGSNGAYSAGPGWDACTGLGRPIGSAILAFLQGGSGPGPTPTPTQLTVTVTPPSNAVIGQPVLLTAVITGAPAGDTYNYNWAFGDNSGGGSNPVSHTYNAAGTYQGGLSITDVNGTSTSTTFNVVVAAAPTPLVVTINGPTSGALNQTLDYNITTVPPASSSADYAWTSDGSPTDSGPGVQDAQVAYLQAGQHVITCTVTDGNSVGTGTLTVTIGGTAPAPSVSVSLGASSIPVGVVENFTATATGFASLDILTYAWSFGDGATASGTSSTQQHTYNTAGTYSGSLVVNGTSGSAHTAFTVTVVGANPPPPSGAWSPTTGLPLSPLLAALIAGDPAVLLDASTPLGSLLASIRADETAFYLGDIQYIIKFLAWVHDNPTELMLELNSPSDGGQGWGSWYDHEGIA